jgi:hypothetical protein
LSSPISSTPREARIAVGWKLKEEKEAVAVRRVLNRVRAWLMVNSKAKCLVINQVIRAK